MGGLIYKETAGLLSLYRKNLVLVAILYGAMALALKNSFFLYFGVWMMGFYALSSFSLDEQSGWGRYARTLPVSDFQVVAAKYVSAMVFMLLGVAYGVAMGVLWSLVDSTFRWLEFLVPMAVVSAIALLSMAVMFLLAVKYGTEKARNFFLVFFLVLFGGFFLLGETNLLGEFPVEKLAGAAAWVEGNMVLSALLALLIAAAVLVVCLFAAAAIYRKKEF